MSSQNDPLKRIQTALNDAGIYKKFTQFIDRCDNVDFDQFLTCIDDSHYSVKDWTIAFLGFDEWLTKRLISGRDFSNMLGYLHCCEMTVAESTSLPEFQAIVNQNLTDYGFGHAQSAQE